MGNPGPLTGGTPCCAPRGAACFGWRWKTPWPSRRSGLGKLEAAWSGVRRGRWEQPRQSRVAPVLPDGPGSVSKTGRYTRGTGVVTPLDVPPAPIRWMWAGTRCAPAVGSGELLVGSKPSEPGGHGEGLRRSRDEAAGV